MGGHTQRTAVVSKNSWSSRPPVSARWDTKREKGGGEAEIGINNFKSVATQPVHIRGSLIKSSREIWNNVSAEYRESRSEISRIRRIEYQEL